jgi:carboxymethylenebutenolidase
MNRLLILLMVFAANTLLAQNGITLCHSSSTEKFAMFASSDEFKMLHPLPRNYVHVSQQGGKMISFKCPDGTEAKGYFIEAKKKSNLWIFVFQEWWGLNDNIKRESELLYTTLGNVNVIALDMYDGQVTDNRDEAVKLIQAFKQERGDMIIKGAIAHAGKNAKIGTIGWCFGGGESLLASIAAGKQAEACVIYYGMPVDDVEKLKTLNADVLGIFAGQEKRISPEVVKKFEADMKAAGKNLTVKSYEADHGFANPSNPIYNEAATKDAWRLTIGFFKAHLK